ncbi:MAG: hypothetical protein JNL28_02965 [Planctomycetes bacterium]|nr:hypothetical protein [Planctomycetota bacterium]
MNGESQSAGGATLRVSWRAIVIAALVLGGLWAFDFYVLRTTLLVTRKGQPPLTPLYTFIDPLFSARALFFIAAAAGLVWIAPRITQIERVSRAQFTALLGLLALLLPFLLFLVRQPAGELGAQSIIFEYQDFLQDAARVESASTFLRDYVATMPSLSLHGQHYPPGPALFLHTVGTLFGLTPLAAGWAVLAAFAAAAVVALFALRELVSERAARQGALLFLCAPSALDHACTALDSLFLLAAACAWWCALRAFRPGACVVWSLALGVLLVAATLASFSALPLGLALTIFALLRVRREGLAPLLRLAAVGASFAFAVWLLWATSGFALWDCLHDAREHAQRFMGRIIRGTPRATWPYRTYGNIVAFAIGAGLVLIPAVRARLAARNLSADRWSPAALLSVCVFTLAPIYFMETERIWIYVLPWLATIAVGSGGFDDSSVRRLLTAGLLQALAMETLLFTYW